MNYRHAFHARKSRSVVKHIVMLQIIDTLCGKERQAVCVFDASLLLIYALDGATRRNTRVAGRHRKMQTALRRKARRCWAATARCWRV
jgi:23S rRNA A2030 N6-methylase RlmJ